MENQLHYQTHTLLRMLQQATQECSTVTDSENTQSSKGLEALEIELKLDGEEPAFATAIGLDTVQVLRAEGYHVHPLYTGQKGGSVEVMIILSQALTFLRDHHTILSEGIQDSSACKHLFWIASCL